MVMRAESGAKGRIDWAFVLATIGLVTLGTLAILSAASPLSHYLSVVRTHFVALFMGSLLFFVGFGINYQVYQDQSKVLYGIVLAALVAVLIFGTSHKGHKAWIHVGFLRFQPAELARIGMILVLAAFLDSRARKIQDLSTILYSIGVLVPVIALIMKQPDLGTTLTLMPIMFGMFFCAGADIAHLLAAMGFGLTAAMMPLMYTFLIYKFPHAAPGSIPYFLLQTSKLGWATVSIFGGGALLCVAAWRLSVMMRMQAKAVYFLAVPVILSAGMLCGILANRQLKGYQRNRFVAYVAPQSDIQGAAYHVNQSQIAIGSGGLWGKGLFNGTQSQLGFLPERHTDFVYSVVGEEMGFAGTMGILSLYLLLIWRIVNVGRLARDRYGFLVCSGLATMFAFELVLNVGMCLGLMPVTGIPLPLISYGGSSLVITLWSLGIVANIYSRRYALL